MSGFHTADLEENVMSDASDKVSEAIGTAKEKLTELADNPKVGEAIGTAKEKLTELADNPKVGEAIDTAKEKFGELKGKMGR